MRPALLYYENQKKRHNKKTIDTNIKTCNKILANKNKQYIKHFSMTEMKIIPGIPNWFNIQK